MRDLTANATIHEDDDGVAHWTYQMVTTAALPGYQPGHGPPMEPAHKPLGYAKRCVTLLAGDWVTYLPVDSPPAARVTCMACLASEE